VKLLLATSIVVAVALGVSTWFSQATIDDIIDSQLKLARDTREGSIRRESDLAVEAVANAVALPLVQNTYADIPPLLASALKHDESSSDKRMQWLAVIDNDHQVVASAGKVPGGAELAKLQASIATTKAVSRVAAASPTEWVYGTRSCSTTSRSAS